LEQIFHRIHHIKTLFPYHEHIILDFIIIQKITQQKILKPNNPHNLLTKNHDLLQIFFPKVNNLHNLACIRADRAQLVPLVMANLRQNLVSGIFFDNLQLGFEEFSDFVLDEENQRLV
jgi:hypothetical protein